MSRFLRFASFRNSLAVRVISSTVLLSILILWPTGSALYNQLSRGVSNVTLDSSVVETRYAVLNAQYRLLLAQRADVDVIHQIIEEVFINSSTVLGTSVNGREVILLLTKAESSAAASFEKTSNGILKTSIPSELRTRVQGSGAVEWARSWIQYPGGDLTPAVVAGAKLDIPGIGKFEMYMLYSLDNQNETLKIVREALLVTGLVLLLLLGLITWLVVRQVVHPVKTAAKIAEQFAAGDYNQRMYVESKDEISRLGISFNEMAESLQAQMGKFERLSQVQQRFVSDVSHELRTPLTTLRMAAEVIHDVKEDLDPNIERSSELLIAQLDRFERLLEDLLEVSRFDADVAVLESIQFDLASLLRESIKDLAPVAKKQEVEVILLGADKPVLITGDARRIERILRNLINNAIAHADSKPVKVSLLYSLEDVAIGVRDYGLGLDEASAPRVFDRFWRADPSRARTRGGTGLGLSIALEDARLHNGELQVWGRPAQGSHFILTLPRVAGDLISDYLIPVEPKDSPPTSL